MLSQLNAYYEAYEEELMELYQSASPLAGFMGMGGHPRDDRCNDIFYRNIEKWVTEFLNTNPSREDAEAVAEWILKLAQVHRNDKTFWFCFAIQTHSKKLSPLMSRERLWNCRNGMMKRIPSWSGFLHRMKYIRYCRNIPDSRASRV